MLLHTLCQIQSLIDPGLVYWTDQQTVMTIAIMMDRELAPGKQAHSLYLLYLPSLSGCRPARNGGGERMSIWQLGGHHEHQALRLLLPQACLAQG